MIDLNFIAKIAKENAFKRGKTVQGISHSCTAADISRELTEFLDASERDRSDHIPDYTQAEEELSDILITCLTELAKRNVNAEEIVTAKIDFNASRPLGGSEVEQENKQSCCGTCNYFKHECSDGKGFCSLLRKPKCNSNVCKSYDRKTTGMSLAKKYCGSCINFENEDADGIGFCDTHGEGPCDHEACNDYVQRTQYYWSPVCIGTTFIPYKGNWTGSQIDKDLFDNKWIFLTEEDCQPLCDKLNGKIKTLNSRNAKTI